MSILRECTNHRSSSAPKWFFPATRVPAPRFCPRISAATTTVRRPVRLRDQSDGPARFVRPPAIRLENSVRLSQARSGRKAIYTCPGNLPGVHSTTTVSGIGEEAVITTQHADTRRFCQCRPPRRAFGTRYDAEQLLGALEAECQAKQRGTKPVSGFIPR